MNILKYLQEELNVYYLPIYLCVILHGNMYDTHIKKYFDDLQIINKT